jgi:hypothetical protein
MTSEMSQPATPPRVGVLKPDYAPAPYEPTWRERINPRMIGVVVVGMLIVGLIGAMFYTWAEQALTGGIVKEGNYFNCNLKAMSLFEMDSRNARDEDIPSRWRALDGQKVILVGETWSPESAGDGIRSFQLCYSIANCCFGGPPKIQHFVHARIAPNFPGADITVGEPVRVEGVLHVGVQRDPEAGTILSVYRIDVTNVQHAG